MKRKKLEAVIDALNDSLTVVAHNSVETEYVLSLKQKYEKHYFDMTGKHYSSVTPRIMPDRVIDGERA